MCRRVIIDVGLAINIVNIDETLNIFITRVCVCWGAGRRGRRGTRSKDCTIWETTRTRRRRRRVEIVIIIYRRGTGLIAARRPARVPVGRGAAVG